MVIRIIGGIPGPILYGHFIDKTCKLWDHSNKVKLEFHLRVQSQSIKYACHILPPVIFETGC